MLADRELLKERDVQSGLAVALHASTVAEVAELLDLLAELDAPAAGLVPAPGAGWMDQPPEKRGKRPRFPGELSVRGGLDEELIRESLRPELSSIRACSDRSGAEPRKIEIRLVIRADGSVDGARARRCPRELCDCVAGVIRGVQFSRPKGGGEVTVRWRLPPRTSR